jgi:hypothetical protein
VPSSLPHIELEEVLSNPKARSAFEELIQAKASPTRILELLQLNVSNECIPRSFDIFFVDGMTRQQVGYFPKHLRRLAREVEKFFENDQFDVKPAPDPAITKLPETLRAYADHLEETLRFGRAFLKKNPRFFDMARISRLKLLDYIERTTGTPQFSMAAGLLHGAFVAANLAVDVDANALRKLYVRRSSSKGSKI